MDKTVEILGKQLTIAKWQTVEVTFSEANVDVVVPHQLNPRKGFVVRFQVLDRQNPGVIYRGTRLPQTTFIVLRATLVGAYRIVLFTEASIDPNDLTALPETTFDGTNFVPDAALSSNVALKNAANVFSLAGNEFQEILLVDKGLKFPATQVASADPNTLDDYEEGSWTPLIGGATSETGQAYSIQRGDYTKVGRKVHAKGYVKLSTKGTITGAVVIKGLPFTSSADANSYSPVLVGLWGGLNTAYVDVRGYVAPSAVIIPLLGIAAAATTNNSGLATGDLTDTSEFIVDVTYYV